MRYPIGVFISFIGIPDTEIIEVMVFGDSITYGAWDNAGGWVQRLREPIDIKNLVNPDIAYFVYNLGVIDDTSTGIIKRFEQEMAARRYLNSVQKKIVIFAVGLNDSELLLKEKKNRVPKELFKRNVNALIDLGKKYADKTIFIGPTPVDEPRAVPLPWDKDLGYRNRVVKEYDNIIRLICKKRNILFLEIFDRIVKLDYVDLLEDGVHPSPAGHLVIYELVRDFLEKNKILDFSLPKRTRTAYRPKK